MTRTCRHREPCHQSRGSCHRCRDQHIVGDAINAKFATISVACIMCTPLALLMAVQAHAQIPHEGMGAHPSSRELQKRRLRTSAIRTPTPPPRRVLQQVLPPLSEPAHLRHHPRPQQHRASLSRRTLRQNNPASQEFWCRDSRLSNRTHSIRSPHANRLLFGPGMDLSRGMLHVKRWPADTDAHEVTLAGGVTGVARRTKPLEK